MKVVNNLYNLLVVGNQKAIVAFVVAAVGTFVAQFGFTVDTTIAEVVESVAVGAVSGVGVWFQANK